MGHHRPPRDYARVHKSRQGQRITRGQSDKTFGGANTLGGIPYRLGREFVGMGGRCPRLALFLPNCTGVQLPSGHGGLEPQAFPWGVY